ISSRARVTRRVVLVFHLARLVCIGAGAIGGAEARADLFVTNSEEFTDNTGNLTRLDGTTGANLGSVIAGNHPCGLCLGPDGNLYVAARQGSLTIRDPATGALIGPFFSGASSSQHSEIVFGPD